MAPKKGTIALMGSGEMTSTMVEVHKELLTDLSGSTNAVFLDTPAGFQLNADDLAQRAMAYFNDRVQHPMRTVSFKSRTGATPYETEKAYLGLRNADLILIGPGSPTYAVSQWKDTAIPEIFMQRIAEGACLIAASAAALTVGRFTLPVYEIYKVGEDLHWVEGLGLLDHFGFPLVVIPHWNNAEGGTHDTRFCYMGEPRFRRLESMLPADVCVLGLDEHTACLLDLANGEGRIRGIGTVTLRHNGREMVFKRGERFPLDLLRGRIEKHDWRQQVRSASEHEEEQTEQESSFWHRVADVEKAFDQGMKRGSPADLVSALLEFDGIIWRGQHDLENPEFIAQARERFRELIVRLGTVIENSPTGRRECLAPLVETLLRLREFYRRERRWSDADSLRECLRDAGIEVEDTPQRARWKLVHDEIERG